jgi:hypothetical protein
MASMLNCMARGKRALFLGFVLFLLAGCAGVQPRAVSFDHYQDSPIPADVASWLEEGPQSLSTLNISAVADQIHGNNRRERLFKAVEYVWANFKYDDWLSDRAFSRSAGELFDERILGGCSDFALAQVTLFRAVGVPARLVLTANTDWMISFQENDLLIPAGHVFIEAYLEDRWYLVDSTYRVMFEGYKMESKSLPRNEYLFERGKDFWSLGIKDVDSLNRVYQPMARTFDRQTYTSPKYSETIISLWEP